LATFDAIVLGTGGIGSAALCELARRGVRVLGIDRFAGTHDRGSSHGRTRITRLAYFEHADYVPLLRRANHLWRALDEQYEHSLYRPCELLQVGPPEGEVIRGVQQSAREHNLDVEPLAADEVERRYDGFVCPESMVGVTERQAGILQVEACVGAHLDEAVRRGAELRTGDAVRGWSVRGNEVVVRTGKDSFSASRLIVTAGAWAGELLARLGLPLEVRRKPMYWFACDDSRYDAQKGAPVFLYETPAGVIYGFPRLDSLGVKVAEHSGGRAVEDPLSVDRDSDPADERLLVDFLQAYLPGVSDRRTHWSVCLYTMTPDGHFIVDAHPEYPQVILAAGLSGHGFKFAPVLGEALADLALRGQTDLPIGFLSLRRFDRDESAP